MSVDVRTLWVTRKSVDAGFHFPELVAAWDEFGIDENYEGWKADCDKALAAVGSDLDRHRYITIRLSEKAVEDAFDAPVIEGQVLDD